MGKFDIPNSGNKIAAKFKAEFEAHDANFQSNLKSLFEAKAPAASQRAAQKIGAWTSLPKHDRDDGGFYERLSTPLHITESDNS